MGELSEGSIVRLKLKNFLTYEEIEFFPKPGLNMIIGPNGSGKSSLVCAICLALAGNPSVLGRAQHAYSFIKYDCSFAEVEIELYRQSGQNLTVWRKITQSKSDWKINGRPSKQESVVQVVSEMNIQVDNLCQFLPQDRVADFAKMTPQQLLVGTEQAVGSEDLMTNHDTLKSMQQELADSSKKVKSLEEKRDREIQVNQHLEADLQAVREFRKVKTQLDLYESKLAWLSYVNFRDKYMTLKKTFQENTKKLKEQEKLKQTFEQQNASFVARINRCSSRQAELGGRMRTCEKNRQELQKIVASKTQRIDDTLHSWRQKLESQQEAKKRLETQREAYGELKNNYERMAEQIQQDNVEGALEVVKKKIFSLNTQLHEILAARELKKSEFQNYETEILETESRIHQLRHQADQRLEIVKKIKPHAYEACLWVRENQAMFTGRIYGPVIAEIKVQSDVAINYLDGAIGADSLFCFVAENPDDMEVFVQQTRKRGWRVNAATAPSARQKFEPPLPREKYAEYGVLGFLSQLFECPKAVYSYLCDNHHLQGVPFGTGLLEEKIYQLNEKYRINFCVSDETWVSLIKSKYSTEVTRSSRSVAKARYLQTSRNANQLTDLEGKLEILKKDRGFIQKDYAGIKERMGELERTKDTVKIEEKKLQQKLIDLRGLKDTLRVKKVQIEKLEQEPVSIEDVKIRTEKQLQHLLNEYKSSIVKLAGLSTTGTAVFKEALQLSIDYDDVEIRKQEIATQLSSISGEIFSITTLLDNLGSTLTEARQKAVSAREYAESFVKLKTMGGEAPCATIPEEMSEKFAKLSNDTNEIQRFINDEKARISLIMPQNANAEEEYKTRQKLIDDLSAEYESTRRRFQELNEKTEELEREWRCKLDALVLRINEKFSDFFKMLQCEGRIELYTGDSEKAYHQYGIKIFVKFRNEGELCELTPFHQSGGERSVSTIIYMMALQELSVVPFRVVDEINQGMDSVNERRVFEFIVKTAERNNAQYFLITPKLLPGLPYSDKIYIHVITPNTNFPFREWNFSNFIEKRRALAGSSQ